jgi:preprotein translocase subunit SecE
MEKIDEEMAVRLLKAQYYMNASNTLVLTGTIFIVGFVTALSVSGPKYELLRMIMLGLVPLGLVALYNGILNYFKAQEIMREGKKVPVPARFDAKGAVGMILLIVIFLTVNNLMYDTWMPSVVTVAALCVTVLLVTWIGLSAKK